MLRKAKTSRDWIDRIIRHPDLLSHRPCPIDSPLRLPKETRRMAIEKATPDMIRQMLFETDWARVATRFDAATPKATPGVTPDPAPVPDEAAILADRVRAVRARFNLSVPAFAARFGLSPATVRDWELARGQAEGAVGILIRVIEHEPDAVIRALSHPT